MKPNCYNCKFRGTVPGSAHSSCKVIREFSKEEDAGLVELAIAGGILRLSNEETAEDLVKLNPHGIKNGWAIWPINFDPVWVDECKFFKEKEK